MTLHRPASKWTYAAFGITLLATLGLVSSAAAVTLTGGPVYTLPGGGSCLVSAGAPHTGTATVDCTGVVLGSHTHVYFGVRNDLNVSGDTMTGTAPAAGSSDIFLFTSSTASSVSYAGATTIVDGNLGSRAVTTALDLTLSAGTGTVVPTGGTPGNNSFGDIERLFEITGGSSFTIDVAVTAASPDFSGASSSGVYDPHASPASGAADISSVDLAFYYSDCGDGVVDSPEQCDEGAANGTATSCCSSTCTFELASKVCRPGAGAPCDLSETCTGSAGICPPDDAPINSGNVCRSGSGDSCDANELCTGVPGQGCPADDAPTNSGAVCRVGSVGGVCDQPEVCTGAPGATCPPDDAPGNLNNVCRAGSGDVCDPDELCTGVPGQGCPAEVVAPPTTVCRAGSGDSCDPDEFCTAVPTQACPSDVVQSAGTECRAAVDACDVAEQCSGTATDPCPGDAFAAASTSCNLDNDLCTTDECDGSGSCDFVEPLDCDDGNNCTQDSCDAIAGCEFDGTPAVSCVSATKATFKYKNNANDARDKVVFVWKGGPALVPNMGDPTQTTDYELCVYDNNGVQMAMGVAPGAGWKTLGPVSDPKGYKFKDAAAVQDGVKIILTKGSSLDKGKAKVIGKKENLPDTAVLPFLFPVIAQLVAEDGMCWEATFTGMNDDTKKNDAGQFLGKIK